MLMKTVPADCAPSPRPRLIQARDGMRAVARAEAVAVEVMGPILRSRPPRWGRIGIPLRYTNQCATQTREATAPCNRTITAREGHPWPTTNAPPRRRSSTTGSARRSSRSSCFPARVCLSAASSRDSRHPEPPCAPRSCASKTRGSCAATAAAMRSHPIDLDEIAQLAEYRETIETAAVRQVVRRAQTSSSTRSQPSWARAQMRMRPERACRPAATSMCAWQSSRPIRSTARRSPRLLRRLERTRWLEARSPEARGHAHDEHLRILAAVRARDADVAEQLIAEHIRGTHERLRDALASNDWRRAQLVL